MQNNKIVLGLQTFQKAQQAHAEKRYAEAVKAYNQALALMPENPKVLLEFGKLTDEIKDWKASEEVYRRLGKARPDCGYEGHLGRALFSQQRWAEAVPFLEIQAARTPNETDVLHALAMSLCSIGRWEDGLAMAQRAWQLKPIPRHIDVVLNALYHMGRCDELEVLATQALARFPDSQEVRSMYGLHKLKSGDLKEGFAYFQDFRWRNNINTAPDAGTPGEWWDGTPFDGTVLVTAEQGLGDELMLSSMFDDLVAMGQRALIECDQRLIPVYGRSYPTLRFVPRGQRKLVDAFEAGGNFRKVNALDFAHFFRQAPEDFPAGRRGWLKADPTRVNALRADYEARWPGKKKVGISWKSQRVMEGGAIKGTQLTDFAPILAVPDCVFLNLQYGDVAADIKALQDAGLGEIQIDARIDATDDIDALCAQLSTLDLVVSTSNTTVHLAGALGVPCLLLLPKVRPILWYWGYRGESTPWYPSLTLMRNPREDDWTGFLRNAVDVIVALSGASR